MSASSMVLSWLISPRIRQATALCRHVRKVLNHQRDILSPQNVKAVDEALADAKKAIENGSDKESLEKQMVRLDEVAGKSLKPYPNATLRENFEVILVALSVAMAIRTFFLQPFKIPTGSMQPTLFGVTSENLSNRKDFVEPKGWARVSEWFQGVSYIHKVAATDGVLTEISQPQRLLIFNLWQTFVQGGKTYVIWFPPDYGEQPLEDGGLRPGRAGIHVGQSFHAGEDIVNLRIRAGDHLFVDRLTYNFRPPRRGEIIVFETRGIEGLVQDQFYIKRMVAMGGEQVQIGDDRHLIIDGKRLDASTPHFQNVYSFDPRKPPMESQFSGHLNEKAKWKWYPQLGVILAPRFPDQSAVYHVEPDHYMVMGDNTMNSFDSRAWGDFPAKNVIGKSFFVYWPLTDRFGWGYYR